MQKKSRRRRPLRVLLLLIVLALSFITATQLFAHRHPYFAPDYPMEDLAPLLKKPVLTAADYRSLFRQTGLGKPGVDGLRALGRAGQAQLLDTQQAFFRPPQAACDSLGLVTREDHHVDAAGSITCGFPMAPLQSGDVLLSFSTHTLGWRHGHAGLVVDAASGATLEAALMGTDSMVADARHWQAYSTFVHLRLRGISPVQQQAIADFALTHMSGIPYRLTSGILGREKFTDPERGALSAQCAYLVWYALMQAGYDTDSNGGRIVTVADLARSPLFEVVQVYGMDPALLTPATP